MAKLKNSELDCGALGWQAVVTKFSNNKLEEMYFAWDRDKICNLKLELDEKTIHDIEDQESQTPSRFKDEMWLAKEKAESEE